MALAVSDSSTLIHLSAINRIELLWEFYDCILIPEAVWREVVSEGRDRPGAKEVERAKEQGWIAMGSPSNEQLLRLLRRELDDGEAEAIALAIEQKADLVLLDESDARRVASLYALRKTGVVGVLMRAKAEGRILSLRRELDRLRNMGGFWIDENLYLRAIAAAGE